MAPITAASEAHHHRSTTKVSNKAFKTRHTSKSALKDRAKGKVESFEKGSRKTPHQQIMSKLDRRNHAKQIRTNKSVERAKEESVFNGRDGAPRIVAIVPLCEDVKGSEVVKQLNSSVDVEEEAPLVDATPWRVEIPRFKQKVQYLTPGRDLLEGMDACRTADFVMFMLSANEEVDEFGEQILRVIESQGVSTVLTGVHNLDSIEPAKKRPDVVKSLKSFITHFFATQEKVHDLSSRQDCSNVMRSLCTTMPKGIRWREDRSWMVAEDVRWEGENAVVTGVVRGRGLKADRLVQVGDWGDFQIEKITAAPLEVRKKGQRTDAMAVDMPEAGDVLEQPTEDQEDLAELAPEEMMEDAMPVSVAPLERKAVLLDDHEYFDEDDRDQLELPKRLPRGTSKYQAAWYLGDVSDSGSDMEDVELEGDDDIDGLPAAGPADGHFDDIMAEPTEAGAPSEYPQTEAFNDIAPDDEAEQIEAYRKQRRDEAEDDREFPDEIELHPHVAARERLARYRGLKSLRTSTWDTAEDKPYEPEEFSRLLEILDYKSAKNRVLKEALVGGVKPGTRVNVHLQIPSDQIAVLQARPKPRALFSLLRHEHKRTAVNMSISLSSDYEKPLRSKEELIVQCGPRRLVINPLFSQGGNTPNNVHKFDRYLHPGRTAVATFLGPVIWGSVPCLFFKRPQPSDAIEDLAQSISDPKLQLIATGTSLPPSTNRVIAKRIILTGHPYKIHKKLVTVRYMFFNTEDVQYFRALQLWTKRGRSGFIKEALGMHGYFKATFDGKVNPMDSVAVSLYKRVWPRGAVAWRPGVEAGDMAGLVEDGGMVVE
ncbi:ribosome biogenesis protein tsr1 [Vermiconidia calcicola]|uniref:Ribosome biogenesis protein tsr1 n=1 Tax=Vermiconidia calcicola TaxID=1690605 RepID=A0ACC3NBE7_9PEZI|nr:ribosome biogenesis protein tsr1 [Vermiconidia calcicola]